MSATIEINLPNERGTASAVSNAMYLQRVTLSYGNQGYGYTTTFTGSGEGAPMKMPDGGTEWYIDWATAGLRAYFQYSTDDGQTWNDSNVGSPQESPEATIVGAEDGLDGDFNDTVLTVTF